MKLSPERVSKEYDKGLKFNHGIDLYHAVETNENFFIGKQWEGVQAHGLPTPVFNFLKRVVLFSVANVSTDNLKLHAKPLPSSGRVPTELIEVFTDILNDQFAEIFERNKLGGLIREFARNAAVDGDGCIYSYWDPDMETGQPSRGGVRSEVLLNTQVMFGNPNSRDVQSQPYILIERRMLVEEARKYARRWGVSDTDAITADTKEGSHVSLDELGGEKVTVLLRMWKDEQTGTVRCYECTRSTTVRKEWDMGVKLYPLVWMSWDYVQDSYHGQALITGLIPNQIFVNKLFAMSMISLMTLAYPKVIYDKTKVSKWSAKVGAAIGVNGSVDGVARIMDPASISPQIGQFIDTAIAYTQKFLGATDAALGDARPDNTSAIIALQRAAATPMELTKQDLLQCMEDLGRIYMAFEAEYYGRRFVEVTLPGTQDRASIQFDFSALKSIPCSIDLDAGASSYWSEIASMQTLDNLLLRGQIPISEYLKRVPNGYISDRESLIAVVQAQEQGRSVDPAMLQGLGNGAAGAEMSPEAAIPVMGGPGNHALQRKINVTGEIPGVR